MDAALDYYSQIVDVVQGRIHGAQGARELNAALASVVAGMWMRLESASERHPDVDVEALRRQVRRRPRVTSIGPLRLADPEDALRDDLPDRLLVEFALRDPRPAVLPGGVPIMPELRRVRESLPPVVRGAYQPLEPLALEPPGNRTGPGLPAGPGAKLSDSLRVGACADPESG
jgi:hypothetical protein